MSALLLVSTILLLILTISWFKVHPFVALLGFGFLFGIVNGLPAAESLALLLEGFARTLKWIALIMIFGTFIGEVASETGGAQRIADSTLRLFGKKRLPVAMGFTGYLLSIPVFVDVAYIMMKSVTESLSRQSGRGILVVGLSLVAGLTATHALLPPTPGPLAVAGIMEASLGKVVLINGFVALFAMAGGFSWAVFGCRRLDVGTGETEPAVPFENEPLVTDARAVTPALVAVFPILIPLLLITASAFVPDTEGSPLIGSLRFLGLPVVALAVGALVALMQFGRHFRMSRISRLIESSIEKSAMVIMITAAGGAFGYVIQNSGIVEGLSVYSDSLQAAGFLFPFIMAVIFTTATGSLTVSMITTASLVAPLLGTLNVSPELAVALVGSGAFCVFHVNSSFFWLLNRMHNIPPAILLRTYTLQSLAMGLSALMAVVILRVFIN